MIIILVAKDKILVVMDTCNYKPYSRLEQVAKDNQLQKSPRGMHSHPCGYILLATARIFHPLTNRRIMRL